MGVHASSSNSGDVKEKFTSESPRRVKDGVPDKIPTASEDQVMLSLSDEPIISLPNEIIIVILSFLSVHDLQSCRKTCRLFRDLTDSSSLWKMKCIREKRFPEKMSASYCPSNWREFYLKQPFSRNLIKNASGQSKFAVEVSKISPVLSFYSLFISLLVYSSHRTVQETFEMMQNVHVLYLSKFRIILVLCSLFQFSFD